MGLNGMERPRAATREARSIDGRRSDGRMRARPGEAGARSEARRSVAVGDARRRRGIAAFASFPGARDGRGGLARRRSAPRGRPGVGGSVEREGARTSRNRGRPAREPAASAFPERGARDATRRSIGGAARDEAGRDAPRAVRELLVGARHVPRGGRPVAHDRHPARGARASRWNAARPERRPTEDQVIGSRRAKGRFAQTEHLSGCSTRERRRPENIIFCARARGAEFGERFVIFSHEHRLRKTRPPRSSSRRSFPRSTGYGGLYRSSHPRAHVFSLALFPPILIKYVACIRAPPPHSPSHASGLGLVADSVRSTTGVAPYMNTPSTYVSASSSPGS